MMVVTDLDGTLLDSRSQLSQPNRDALEALGRRGVLRVVATGRSLYSARRTLGDDFPIDYLVFSTGAGIVEWSSGKLINMHDMSAGEVKLAVDALVERNMDFMLHCGVPDNHYFYFHRAGAKNPDFDRRRARYGSFAKPLTGGLPEGTTFSQVLAIEPPGAPARYEELRDLLDSLSVVLTTSPLDGVSRWIEIFPPQVSKSKAAEWLGKRHGIARARVLAVGNDFNDSDLLEWAATAYVVANGPAELLAQYEVVATNEENGFAHAVRELLV